MRITQDNPGPHRNQLVDEEQAAFEHLLEHQNNALALCRRHDGNRHRIGRERRPGLILDLGNVTAEVLLNPARLSGPDHEIVALDVAADSEPLEIQRA